MACHNTRHASFDWLAGTGIIFPEDDPESPTFLSYSSNRAGLCGMMVILYRTQNHERWSIHDLSFLLIGLDFTLDVLAIHEAIGMDGSFL